MSASVQAGDLTNPWNEDAVTIVDQEGRSVVLPIEGIDVFADRLLLTAKRQLEKIEARERMEAHRRAEAERRVTTDQSADYMPGRHS